MHTTRKMKKKKKYKKEKSLYSDQFLVATVQTLPKQHQKSIFSKSDASNKETMHKRRHRPIIDLRFHLGESPWSQNNAFNKAIARHNQGRTLNSSCTVAPTCRCRCYESRIPKQVPIATRDSNHLYWSSETLAFMSFSVSDFIMDHKIGPIMATDNIAPPCFL
jgi:hypothetical protein